MQPVRGAVASSSAYGDRKIEVASARSNTQPAEVPFGHCMFETAGVEDCLRNTSSVVRVSINPAHTTPTTTQIIQLQFLASEEAYRIEAETADDYATWVVPMGHSQCCPAKLIDKDRVANRSGHIRVGVCVLVEYEGRVLVSKRFFSPSAMLILLGGPLF